MISLKKLQYTQYNNLNIRLSSSELTKTDPSYNTEVSLNLFSNVICGSNDEMY